MSPERKAELEAAGHVTCDEADEAIARFNASHWRGRGDHGEVARYSIPANPKRDDDIRLSAFVEQHRAAIIRIATLEAALRNAMVLHSARCADNFPGGCHCGASAHNALIDQALAAQDGRGGSR